MATQTINAPARKSPSFRERLQMNGGILPYVLVFPTILLILVVAVYPMINSLWLSLLDNPSRLHPAFVGFQNFVAVLSNAQFVGALEHTWIFTVVSVFLETVFGLGIALLINKTFPGRGLVRAAILVPWAFPTVVSAQMWLLMYSDQSGIITYILQVLHLLAPGDTVTNSPSGVIIASLVTDVWKTTPFMAVLLLAGLQVIPSELYEAAGVDGSTRFQSFWRITLPMLKGPLLIALLFRTLDAIRVFDLFYIFGGNTTESLASQAYFNMFKGSPTDFAPGIANAVIIFIFGLLISLVFLFMMRDTLKGS